MPHALIRTIAARRRHVLTQLALLIAMAMAATLLAAGSAAAVPPPGQIPDEPTEEPLPDDPGGTPGPTPSSPSSGMKRVQVKLVNVRATEIEDVCCFGLARDAFYVLGNVQVGENRAAITSSPRNIGNGQTVSINETLIDAIVPANAALHLSMLAYDRDAGKVFEDLPQVIDTIGTVCGLAAPFDPSGIAQTCVSWLPTAKAIASLLGPFNDRDDRLGTLAQDLMVSSFPNGTSRRTWHFEDMTRGSWSDWNYDVTYEVTVS
jgi:hypothetical protein